ncbi:uncharacterized protein LTR77_003842 [Saxophila tyrrhenica]|uniref:Potassium transport protein n=1 Tax=Saxophila tyrrhenica TaxID=1690608 RepID=A0AAV9PFJ2_9PEZI|nr:hypothetical protein LTR77_003842 [Saxophila tyrrhenica]
MGQDDDQQPVKKTLKSLFHFNFYRIHLLYFILTILITSVILYGSNTASFQIGYADALFLCTSAMCNTGLNPVNISSLSGFQQSILFVLMFLGDLTTVTISVVYIRRYFFSRRMSELVQESNAARRVAEDIEDQPEGSGGNGSSGRSRSHDWTPAKNQAEHSGRGEREPLRPRRKRDAPLADTHLAGYGSFPAPWHSSRVKKSFDWGHGRPEPHEHHYLSFQPRLDHKGRITQLDEHQRNELGGVEYRALKVLSWLLPLYTLGWLLVVVVALTPYATLAIPSEIRNAQYPTINPIWWAIFTSLSSYSNSGLNFLNSSMIPLRRDYFVLILTGTAILAGNTLYPVFLRLAVWTLSKVVRKQTELHHSLSFLLQHPRRCYLLLFPGKSTWNLFIVQVSITLVTWIFWILLNIDQPIVDPGFGGGQRAMDGLYQALGLRSCGFYIVEMRYMAPALQFFFLVVMYISAYPIIMSLRSTNIYEERSLGQDDRSKYAVDDEGRPRQSQSQLGVHIRQQLAYDIWWLIAAAFLVCIIEHQELRTEKPGFTIFSVMFETVSAYGNIGLSLGVPYNSFSFSGAWHVLSKLILLTVMLRGRHRILPYAVDRAVLLPGEELMEKLDREYSTTDDHRWQQTERRIREDERGAQAEISGESGQQDPEHGQQSGSNG